MSDRCIIYVRMVLICIFTHNLFRLSGKYESTGTLPTDLDACNAHFGTTPDSTRTSIYHHHVTDATPFAVGCYGYVTLIIVWACKMKSNIGSGRMLGCILVLKPMLVCLL